MIKLFNVGQCFTYETPIFSATGNILKVIYSKAPYSDRLNLQYLIKWKKSSNPIYNEAITHFSNRYFNELIACGAIKLLNNFDNNKICRNK